jgi:FAD/FMN-containing dehydrogenase
MQRGDPCDREGKGMLLTNSRSTDTLRDRLQGEVILAGAPGYDDARRGWNLAADLRPAMVVQPRSAEDVREVVTFAAGSGLRVLLQGTGHNATPMGDLSDVILVRTHAMRGVAIDAERRVARVEAGAVWSDVTGPASEHGLAALAGAAPHVGVVGYVVGGGVGWLGRRYGLASDRVLSFDVVTADGRLSRTDRDNDPDLFWALRGGGGSHAAIVALEMELIPVPAVTGGMMLFDWNRAREVMQAWREFTTTVTETVTTSIRLMQVPDMPTIPDFIRGRGVVVIDGAVLAGVEEAAAMLAPLRELGPEMDTFAQVPPVALSYIHMDPEEPMAAMSEHAMLDSLPASAIDLVVDRFGQGSGSPLTMVEFRHVGGALGRPGTGALSRLDGEYLMFAGGAVVNDALTAANEMAFASLRETLAPWSSTRMFANFAERPLGPEALYGAAAATRLRAVRSAYDPNGVFTGAHAGS